MILIVFTVVIFAIACLVCLIALLIIGYRDQLRRVTESANYNAAAWARSEAELYEKIVLLAQAEAIAVAECKRGDELYRITRQALDVANKREFGVPMADGGYLPPRDPNETYTLEIVPTAEFDPLDADELY